ncbi:MAG: hypothetical protein OXP09_17300 [Gammaproteobacteria bacterium]|nr:hypothetical protein [Gammaproteobacteria bacterium]MDE0367315.1 hypothetical protein [Gammaproteobacteria bacterium]
MSLPERFSELETYVEKWDQPDYNARYAVRLASSMEELRDFYAAMLERAEDIKSYLDRKSFDQYQDEDRRLARLMFAVSVVGPAVDIYRSPVVPDSGATSFEMVLDVELPG